VKALENISMVEVSKKSRIRQVAVAFFVLLCLAYGYFYLTTTTTSSDDAFECKAIANLVTSEHSVPESTSSPGRPAIFCDVEVRGFFLQRFDHIRIYGVTDKDQQDSITRTLERYRGGQKARREIVLDFYQKENWRTWADSATGNKGGERGSETVIRKIAIK
jgi:hypothetical protein